YSEVHHRRIGPTNEALVLEPILLDDPYRLASIRFADAKVQHPHATVSNLPPSAKRLREDTVRIERNCILTGKYAGRCRVIDFEIHHELLTAARGAADEADVVHTIMLDDVPSPLGIRLLGPKVKYPVVAVNNFPATADIRRLHIGWVDAEAVFGVARRRNDAGRVATEAYASPRDIVAIPVFADNAALVSPSLKDVVSIRYAADVDPLTVEPGGVDVGAAGGDALVATSKVWGGAPAAPMLYVHQAERLLEPRSRETCTVKERVVIEMLQVIVAVAGGEFVPLWMPP